MAKGRSVGRPPRRRSQTSSEGLADRVIDGALEFVEENAPEALTLRGVHAHLKGGFSASAPLHHFGSMIGLYAGVAARGFEVLIDHLRTERKRGVPGADTVHAVVLAYGQFALQRPNLYRVMHWPAAWARLAEIEADHGDARSAAAEAIWLRRAKEARDRAFAEIEITVELGQAAGAIAPSYAAQEVARVLTSIVDGFLFQTLFEHVIAPKKTLRAELDRYVRMAIVGVGARGR